MATKLEMATVKSFARKTAAGNPWAKKISRNVRKNHANIPIVPYQPSKMAALKSTDIGKVKVKAKVTNRGQWLFITAAKVSFFCLSRLASEYVAEASGKERFQPVVSSNRVPNF